MHLSIDSSLCKFFMDRILNSEESSSHLTETHFQLKYRIACKNNYKVLIPKANSNSSDCRISKKIPHFACFSCHKVLQSEESNLNMKAKLSFLRSLVIREIPYIVGFHSSLILHSEEFELKESSSSN